MDALITSVGFGLAAATQLALAVLLLLALRRVSRGAWLAIAAAVTAVWATAHAFAATGGVDGGPALVLVEFLRPLAWLVPLTLILQADAGGRSWRWPALMICTAVVFLLASVASGVLSPMALVIGLLLATLAGLVFIERIYRASDGAQRWSLKHLCVGLGLLFAFDFYYFSTALLFGAPAPGLELGRAAVAAVAAPLVAVSAARTRRWSLDIGVSRRLVTDSFVITAAGVYLLAMAGAGYYLRLVGGTWGPLLQSVFLAGAVALLLVGVFSSTLRARLRVLVSKHFFSYGYDYREEWLRFVNTLSDSHSSESLRVRALRALAQIVDSGGGLLFSGSDSGNQLLAATWNVAFPGTVTEPASSPLLALLREREWILDLEEIRRDPAQAPTFDLPEWLGKVPDAWLVVPLLERDRLRGFAVLAKPRAPRPLNWEDRDLLRTAGRQVASYLALADADEALMDARQFDAYQRLSAFVVHDLKNVSAQLSLITRNARRHRQNPEFVDDAFRTVESATARLDRVLQGLRKSESAIEEVTDVDVPGVLAATAEACADETPRPAVEAADQGLRVSCPPGRLQTILEHLVRNAQQATSAEGQVVLSAVDADKHCRIEIRDTGCGMSQEFIREQLFRPFVTSKGNAGMGIGVYEARQFVESLGGLLDVFSQPGEGTRFVLRLPRMQADAPEGVEPAEVQRAQS
ncbi:XrtA/PEP-CTERM system histidine kinase PrsK [Sediminicurvatus halobius]|uniref:histidine kinase n=1 Tax=Sediminicurvatus halobius TaxID=2182432 RepID=A0A2U2N0D0_9GAMM|nr:XrtA/PEP-CTERM system histidine kinase PrsK [Spiribacter halobius]PWG62695.1 PEP-CTERM system histidine kinase PrsK [Spiribacter halobius]UEX77364.1 PEP-CTERM system histidine kinase PrsK [Spiribacter halobius]